MELDFIHFSPVPELKAVNIKLLYWDPENIGVEELICKEEIKSEQTINDKFMTICVTKSKNKSKARNFIREYKTPCMLMVIGKTYKVKRRTRAGRFRCQSEVDTFFQSVGRLLQRYVYSYLVAYTNFLSVVLQVQEKITYNQKNVSSQNVCARFSEHGIQGPSSERGT